MEIEVRLFAILQKHLPPGSSPYSCRLHMGDESRVMDVLTRLSLPAELPKILLVNGVKSGDETTLKDGDVLSVFPPLGGG